VLARESVGQAILVPLEAWPRHSGARGDQSRAPVALAVGKSDQLTLD
jgi:hypothetical protein